MKITRPLLLLVALFALNSLRADNPPPAPAPKPDAAAALAAAQQAAKKIADSLHYQKGTVVIQEGLAKVAMPEYYRYLNAADSETLLTQLWGNPKGTGTIGMIVPAEFDPLIGDSWAVILSFAEDGYVKDDDAAKINYTDMLKKMKEDVSEGNKVRTKEGYAPIELVGWASPPRYDAANHKLYWAKELKFGNEADHTLNYNIRMLGRRGVLVLNAVAPISQLKQVEGATPALLAMVDFQEGHRYTDFKNDTDKVATYGLAALVAGGVAAKAGFFKLLWVGILAFKKIILLALIALGSSFKKGWDWIRGRQSGDATTQAGPPAAS